MATGRWWVALIIVLIIVGWWVYIYLRKDE